MEKFLSKKIQERTSKSFLGRVNFANFNNFSAAEHKKFESEHNTQHA